MKYSGRKSEITISPHNFKLPCPNISLPPIESCDKTIGCSRICYGMKAWRLYQDTRRAWGKNLLLYKTDKIKFFSLINDYITAYAPRYFRWHSAGDIPDRSYLSGMFRVARKNLETRFLCFTKRYEWIVEKQDLIPPNLCLVLSTFPGVKQPKHNLHIAFYQNGKETRVNLKQYRDNTTVCTTSCYECKICWYLNDNKKHVLFYHH